VDAAERRLERWSAHIEGVVNAKCIEVVPIRDKL